LSDALRLVVIDASAGIQLFIEEEQSRAVTAIFSQLDGKTPLRLHVPDLFFIECANILLKWTRRTGDPLTKSRAHLADLKSLALTTTETADLMEDALVLAEQTGLTAYDACYLALAGSLDAALLTVDTDLLALHPFEGLAVLTPAAFLE
jgi:predicted nucleic acid-binding protein